MKMYWFCSLVLILLSTQFVENRKECVAKEGKSSPFCVCNATYCDDLDPIVKELKGTVLLFETNKAGLRHKQSKLKFSGDKSVGENEIVLTLNNSVKYQKIIGFGGAFTDASGLNLNSLPKEMAENVMKDYFSTNGIQYNMARVPMAGADFSTHPYTYDDNVDDFNLTQFKLQPEDFNYKIPYMKLASKFTSNKLKLFGSPWASPAWMKTNNKINHGGFLIGKPGEKYYKIWANYFVKFLDAYKSNGIEFWGMTVENEPKAGFDQNYAFNCLGFTAENERDFVKKDLGPALEQAGYGRDKLALMIYDDGRKDQMIDWIDTCFNDTETAKYVHGLAYHCYENKQTSWELLDQIQARHPDQFILSTECCQEFRILAKGALMNLGNWNNSEEYIKDVMLNLQHWGTGYIEWNYALDMYGQPNWAHFSSEAPILLNATAKEYYKDPKFYVLGQFSKFLAPDSIRISSKTNKDHKDLNFVAFDRPDNATVVIVYNLNDSPLDFVINDPNNGKLSAKISEHSIQTYIYWN